MNSLAEQLENGLALGNQIGILGTDDLRMCQQPEQDRQMRGDKSWQPTDNMLHSSNERNAQQVAASDCFESMALLQQGQQSREVLGEQGQGAQSQFGAVMSRTK